MQFRLKEWVIPVVSGVISFGAGAGFGYFLHQRTAKPKTYPINPKIQEMEDRQLQLDFERAERDREFNFQVQQASHLANEMKEASKALLERLVEPLIHPEARSDHPSNGSATVMAIHQEHEDEALVTSIFVDDEDDEWDYDIEIAERDANPGKPYIIHRDEYDEEMGDESIYSHSQLTFYEGDNILCDEYDVPVYNADKVVGKLIFGHGSCDPSICFVRNDKLEAQYEVIIDHGWYQTEVLGQQIEHAHKRAAPKPKFRME